MDHKELIEAIDCFKSFHKLSSSEFCILAGIDEDVLNKVINRQHYVCLHDIKKLAKILKLDTLSVLSGL